MCCFQVCLLSNVIPRYVASSSSFSGVQPRVTLTALCFGDRVNKMVGDLSLLNATHHFSVQLLSLSAANCILYVAVDAYSSLHQITKSSAYNAALMPLGSSKTRSLVKSRNKVGLGLLPVEHRALVELSPCELYRDSCPAAVEVGFYPVTMLLAMPFLRCLTSSPSIQTLLIAIWR